MNKLSLISKTFSVFLNGENNASWVLNIVKYKHVFLKRGPSSMSTFIFVDIFCYVDIRLFMANVGRTVVGKLAKLVLLVR